MRQNRPVSLAATKEGIGRTCRVPEVDDEAENNDHKGREVQPVDGVVLCQGRLVNSFPVSAI